MVIDNAVKDFKMSSASTLQSNEAVEDCLPASQPIVPAHTDFLPVTASANAIKKGIQLTADDWRLQPVIAWQVQPYGKEK